MDNSKEFQLMLDEAAKSEPLAFKGFDRTKNVQDQLQEMMGWKRNCLGYVEPLWHFILDTIDTPIDETQENLYWVNNILCGSMEQLWLSFVMKKLYNKVWYNGWKKM